VLIPFANFTLDVKNIMNVPAVTAGDGIFVAYPVLDRTNILFVA
jgi:hypothetical protein